MGTSIQTVLAIVALLLLFAPAILIVYAGVRIRGAIGGTGPIYIFIGAVLLSLASLDFLGHFMVSMLFDVAELAAFAMVSVYVVKAMNYLGLLSIGVGLMLLIRQLRNTSA